MSRDEWQTLTESLEELERTDPEVRAARERLDQAIWEIANRPPRRRFTKGCGGES
jgi:hypothetical protein